MRICAYPFSRIELSRQQYIPCCGNWLTEGYYKEFSGQGSDWNGPAAQALRQSIFEGNFRFCKREVCQVSLFDVDSGEANPIPESPISEANLVAVKEKQAWMPEGPSSITINTDDRCNLACPSCRKEKIVVLSEGLRRELEYSDAQLMKYAPSIEVIRIGNGEIFFSPWLKQLIRNCNKSNFPRLRHIYAFSNGLLFNQRNYDNLLPGISYLKYLSISVDAGTQSVYSKVRGGDWSVLSDNLRFVSSLKRQKKIPYFQLNFLVRKANYKSIPDFVQWAKQFEISNVKFNPFFSFEGMGVSYEEEAVHLPAHPEYAELVKIREELRNDPLVRWAVPL